MTLDEKLQELRRAAEARPDDVTASGAYLDALERAGGQPADYLQAKINPLACLGKSIILAKSARILFPVYAFRVTAEPESTSQLYPAFFITKLHTAPDSDSDYLFLIQHEGLRRMKKPGLLLNHVYATREEHLIDYLTYGAEALRIIS